MMEYFFSKAARNFIDRLKPPKNSVPFIDFEFAFNKSEKMKWYQLIVRDACYNRCNKCKERNANSKMNDLSFIQT